MILDIFLPLALAFIMFSLGLGLTVDDFKRVASHPLAFAVGAAGQLLILPAVALARAGNSLSADTSIALTAPRSPNR